MSNAAQELSTSYPRVSREPGQYQPRLGRVVPNSAPSSAYFRHFCPSKLVPMLVKLDKHNAEFGPTWSMLFKRLLMLASNGPDPAEFGQAWPILANLLPMLANFGQDLVTVANISQVCPKFGQR